GDDITETGTIAKYFSRWNMITVQVEDGNKAVELIRSEAIDLVAIDAQMKSSATEIAAKIRKIKIKRELPIILFNADQTENILFEYTDQTVSAVIPKNVDRSKIL